MNEAKDAWNGRIGNGWQREEHILNTLLVNNEYDVYLMRSSEFPECDSTNTTHASCDRDLCGRNRNSRWIRDSES